MGLLRSSVLDDDVVSGPAVEDVDAGASEESVVSGGAEELIW